jgi:outer membrane protein
MRHHAAAALAALALAASPRLARPAELKIGYVNLQQAVNEVDEGKKARDQLKKEFDQKQKVLDEKQNDLKKLKDDLDKQSVVMSDEAKRDKQMDFERRVMEVQGLFVQLQKELGDREREMMKGIFDKMELVIKEIAEAEGLTYVFEQQNAGILYAPQSMNVTNELVRKYNARFKGGAAAAPAEKKTADAPAKAEPAKKADGAKK